ncbi:Crp/Fnr family transcriptional regulator [Microcoleus sp. FACHB-672]|uniref:Crp/Fnr family transcriptional regulator n=1 Tax=Microcoleus sp. FACHB-672 TaxID=2692825 RepID=UPI0016832B4F|nr:Crp/Fnr family transcriptional regulator [Microcoleus sp. FACHB-672]MBD2039389.1 Crp/Fnr family transcriptional regulator [Microcoleus sp. FACHB-672]
MPVSKDSGRAGNQLLAALPAEEYQRLVPYLEKVELNNHQVLYNPNELIEFVYFPTQGVVSLLYAMEDGSTVEVGIVGAEGMVGIPVILGGMKTTNLALVQVAGYGMRLKASLLKSEFERGGVLQTLLLRYSQALLSFVSQTAACNRLHTLEERLSRWLLLVQHRLQSDELPLTQEYISQMLGTRRSGVTVAAGTLQQAGIISYKRGKINILNQENLEATACECYQVIQSEFARLLNLEQG